MQRALVTFSLLLLCCLVHAKYLSGTVDSTENTVFFGKFTFNWGDDSTDPASLTFRVANVAPLQDSLNDNIRLNIYTNDPTAPWYFPDIWDNPNLTCEEKVASQKPINGEYGLIVNGTDVAILFFGEDRYSTFFFTISDCELGEGQYLQMKTEMTWENPGSWWYSQFSMEDQNLLTIYLIFFVFWIVLAVATMGCIIFFFIARNRDLDWNMYLFQVSTMCQCLAMFLYSVHYLLYAGDGLGVPSFFVIADVLVNISEISLMLMFLQIASLCGSPDKLNIVVLYSVGILLVCYMFGFLWMEIYPGLNPTELVFEWVTAPGMIMIVNRILLWLLFVALSIKNSLQNRERSAFLIVFCVSFSLWFLALPCMVLFTLGTNYVYQWKIVLGLTQTVYVPLFALFLVLSTPNPISIRINSISFAKSNIASGLSKRNSANFMNNADGHILSEDEEL